MSGRRKCEYLVKQREKREGEKLQEQQSQIWLIAKKNILRIQISKDFDESEEVAYQSWGFILVI